MEPGTIANGFKSGVSGRFVIFTRKAYVEVSATMLESLAMRGEPPTGNTVWSISNGVPKELFEGILKDFAKSAGVGLEKRIVLQLDGVGWHGPENIAVPDGIQLVFLACLQSGTTACRASLGVRR